MWLFGYGSLIWRPDFAYEERCPARLHGWMRRFWQGSHDHRGVPRAPGRVVTLVPAPEGFCDGVAYRVSPAGAEIVLAALDHREKNGYERREVALDAGARGRLPGLVYVATPDNPAFLGPAPVEAMVEQIRRASGPSGSNADYLLDLARALRALGAHDPHVFGLEAALAPGRPGAAS